MTRPLQLAAAAALALASATSSAALIGFEDLAVGPGVNSIGGDRVSTGFSFDSSANHTHLSNNSFDGNSGSTFLVVDDFDGANTLTVAQVGGAAFSLISVDLGEWNPGGGLASQITLTGQVLGGGTVQTILALDGVVSVGGSNNFQTFALGGGWSNLFSVTFDATAGTGSLYWALDNVLTGDANAVPEPTTLALVGLGMLGLAARRKARQA
jgi:hypothetical protein